MHRVPNVLKNASVSRAQLAVRPRLGNVAPAQSMATRRFPRPLKTKQKGIDILHDPIWNKGLAFDMTVRFPFCVVVGNLVVVSLVTSHPADRRSVRVRVREGCVALLTDSSGSCRNETALTSAVCFHHV